MPSRINHEGCGMAVANQEYDMKTKDIFSGAGCAALLAIGMTANAGGIGGVGGLGGGLGGGIGGNLSGFGARSFSGAGNFTSQGEQKTAIKDPVVKTKGAVDTAKDKVDTAKDTAAGAAADKVSAVKDSAGNLAPASVTQPAAATTAAAPTSQPAAASGSHSIAGSGSLDAQHDAGSNSLNGTLSTSSN